MYQESLDLIPIWVVFIILFLLAFACAEIGFYIGKIRREFTNDKDEKQGGTILGPTLGLLAFMLAFTYNSANDIHSKRMAQVIDEANAIQNAWLRSQLLEEPSATEAKRILRDYVGVRIEGSRSKDLHELSQAIKRSEELQAKLWQLAVNQVKAGQSTAVTGSYIMAVNKIIEVHENRLNAALKRVPGTVILTLIAILSITLTMLGYQSGLNGVRTLLPRIGLIVALSFVMLLITDLDRPGSGLIAISQDSLIKLQLSMDAVK